MSDGPPFAAFTHEPATVLRQGQKVQITGAKGKVFAGRIAQVTGLHSPNGPVGFVIQCTLEADDGPGQA